jgi:hypothetical protein
MGLITRLYEHFFPRRIERRSVPRYALVIPLTLRTSSGDTYSGFTRDMGAGGLGALVAADLPLGEEVTVTYQLPDGSPPQSHRATVRNRNGNRHGFQFTDTTKIRNGGATLPS